MSFYCCECGIKASFEWKFCAKCGNNLSASKKALSGQQKRPSPARSHQGGSWDLSGDSAFILTARIKSSFDAGMIAAKCFPGGLWKNGGDEGQGKMLFLRGGRLCFDIGWVGCVTGRTRVSDGRSHVVAVKFEDGTYKVLVDGIVDGSGLYAVKDHPGTVINVGKKIGHHVGSEDMAPDFRGEIDSVQYNSSSEEDEFEVVMPSESVPVAKEVQAISEAMSMRTFNLSESTCTITGCRTRTSGKAPTELGGASDLAQKGKAYQSSNYNREMKAANANRGNFDSSKGFGGSGTYSHTSSNDRQPYWGVNLLNESTVQEVHVYGRPGFARRLTGVRVIFLGNDGTPLLVKEFENSNRDEAFKLHLTNHLAGVKAVRLEKMNPNAGGDEKTFNLNVVQVFGYD
mmetsp:Transcript_15555/g.32054  ORF Transcript_15555/g.32054 Transcript_15555/m.32054 type:complete len:400 (+) Transcript_15555:26-1225(+)